MGMVISITAAFWDGFCNRTHWHHYKEKQLRNNLSESQIDTMVDDSFPASDPPSTY